MTNITPFCTENSKHPDINKFFSAQDKTGKKIFIKASKDSHLVQPEYWAIETRTIPGRYVDFRRNKQEQ